MDDIVPASHDEFVDGYRSGLIGVAVDWGRAYVFAASQGLGWEWTFTGYLALLLGAHSISTLYLVLSFVLHDPWLLLGIPAAVAGTKAAAPDYEIFGRGVVFLLITVALAGLFFGSLVLGWRSPVFLISVAFLVTFATIMSYHAICRRTFLRLLLTREDFYEDAIERNLIVLQERELA